MNKNVSSQLSKFGLLRDKKILAILDGDSKFGSFRIEEHENEIIISMPYLSGPVLCDLCCNFGLPTTYSFKGGALSRWEYLDNLLLHCIENDKVSRLLDFLFSKNQFYPLLKNIPKSSIDLAHSKIVNTIIEEINNILLFGGNELRRFRNNFVIQPIGTTITLETPLIKNIDRSYINDISARALKDISEGNFDSAITKARTLLEEVFCYAIEAVKDVPTSKGDIRELYNQVKNIYNMQQKNDYDKRINNLLSGLEKILSSISEMRNKGSDAHGLGLRRINIEEHIARLFVNSSATMSDFILAVCERKKNIN